MALIRYEPWRVLNDFQNEINRMFDHRRSALGSGDETQIATSDWIPAVDIKEEENQFVIYADLPGVDSKDIEVTMEKGVLTIKGQRHSETTEEHNGYKRVERSSGSFQRSFSLPDTADAERVSARGKNGVLEIVIPKKERSQPRKITVES